MESRVVNQLVAFNGSEDEKAGSTARALRCPRERLRVLRMHDHNRGARVVVHLPDAVLAQVAVHHHPHRAHLQSAEERGREVGHVREADQDALLGVHADRFEGIREAVGARLERRIGDRLLSGSERDPVAQPFPDAVVQEIIGDVERVRGLEGHRG